MAAEPTNIQRRRGRRLARMSTAHRDYGGAARWSKTRQPHGRTARRANSVADAMLRWHAASCRSVWPGERAALTNGQTWGILFLASRCELGDGPVTFFPGRDGPRRQCRQAMHSTAGGWKHRVRIEMLPTKAEGLPRSRDQFVNPPRESGSKIVLAPLELPQHLCRHRRGLERSKRSQRQFPRKGHGVILNLRRLLSSFSSLHGPRAAHADTYAP
jgi:hypothetical protein